MVGHLRKQDKFKSEVMDSCMEEARPGGTLLGPYDKDDIDAMFNGRWVPVPRFGIGQGKVRMIDDASIFLHNSTVARKYKLI